MTGNDLLSITSISDYSKSNIKLLKRREITYKDNLLKLQMDPNLGIYSCRESPGKPSMGSPYKVDILMNDDCITKYSRCSCLLKTNYNLSSTDKPCLLSVRKNNLSTEIKIIN